MGTRTKDVVNTKTPSKKVCMTSYYDKKLVDALSNLEKIAGKNPNATIQSAVNAIIDDAENRAVSYVEDYGKYLRSSYGNLWDFVRYYTGNFRAGIKVYGDFSKDPVSCTIDFDEDWFFEEKDLPALKSRTRHVHRVWTTKGGVTNSNDYVYHDKPGKMIHIYGSDYRPKIPPYYIMDVLDEMDDIERDKAGVN